MPNAVLVELFARGMGIIDEAQLEFSSGFNVLTGETGAGKTLLIGALNLCLGGDPGATRHAQSPSLRTAAVFVDSEGRETVLGRESSASGRLRSTVDGVSTSAEALREVARGLIVIHGQHDSLILKNRGDVLRLIDSAGAIDATPLREVRNRLAALREERAQLGGDAGSRERELDFLSFQIDEIERAEIKSPDEMNVVVDELSNLSQLRESQLLIEEIVERLDGESDEALLNEFARWVSRLPRADVFSDVREQLATALEAARTGLRELVALSDPERIDEVRIVELEGRIAVLRNLARKYGGALDETLESLSTMRRQRERLLHAEARLSELDAQIVELEASESSLSEVLRRARVDAAAKLTEAVRAELPRVALSGASLRFRVDGDDGSAADILFCANPGGSEAPIQALASGGELSRVLLAVALQTAPEDVVAVFDEVDAGIGGQVAQQIGDCLRELGQRQQVIAVTHLASVAAKADRHFVVEKLTEQGSAVTRVRALDDVERVDEIARMLAGNDMTSESRALARRLLETSR